MLWFPLMFFSTFSDNTLASYRMMIMKFTYEFGSVAQWKHVPSKKRIVLGSIPISAKSKRKANLLLEFVPCDYFLLQTLLFLDSMRANTF